MGDDYIGTEHLLLGLIREEEGVAAQVLVALGANLECVREAVIAMPEGYAGGPAMTPVAQVPLIETPSKTPPSVPTASRRSRRRWRCARSMPRGATSPAP